MSRVRLGAKFAGTIMLAAAFSVSAPARADGLGLTGSVKIVTQQIVRSAPSVRVTRAP